MVSTVNKSMLETKCVTDAVLQGDNIVFTYTDATTQVVPIGSMPAIAQIAGMVSKIAAINAYIASHP